MVGLFVALDAEQRVVEIQQGDGGNPYFFPVVDWYEPKMNDPVRFDSAGQLIEPDPEPQDGKRYTRATGAWQEDTKPLPKREQVKEKEKTKQEKINEYVLAIMKADTKATGAAKTARDGYETVETEINTLNAEIAKEEKAEQSNIGSDAGSESSPEPASGE